MTRSLVCLAFFLASGKQIAYVDLTVPPKTPEINTNGGIIRSSGGCVFDRRTPDPQTLPVSVKLSRIFSPVENGLPKDAVEFIVTNTGEKEITLPIGADPVQSLAPYASDRRELNFTLLEGDDGYGFVGFGTAVSSAINPDSLAHLAPGDSVAYKVPIDLRLANKRRELRNGATLQLSVRVHLGKIVIDQGSDLHAQVGDEIRSGNSLPWPPQ